MGEAIDSENVEEQSAAEEDEEQEQPQEEEQAAEEEAPSQDAAAGEAPEEEAPQEEAPSEDASEAAGAGPEVADVSVAIDPDEGCDQHAHSVEVSRDAKLILQWSSNNATRVDIEGVGSMGPSGSVEIPAEDATYSLVAKDDDGAESDPWLLDVHTHDEGEVVSGHVDVSSGVARIVEFAAQRDSETVTEASFGDSIDLVLTASDACESAQIAGQDAPLSPTHDGFQEAWVTIQIGAKNPGPFEATVSAGGEVADSATAQLDVALPEAAATLELVDGEESAAGEPLELHWSATGAVSAKLTATPEPIEVVSEGDTEEEGRLRLSVDPHSALPAKLEMFDGDEEVGTCEFDLDVPQGIEDAPEPALQGDPPTVAFASLVGRELELPLDDAGNGEGTIMLDPGPGAPAKLSLRVQPVAGEETTAEASAKVANFDVKLLLDDGTPAPAHMHCKLTLGLLAGEPGTASEAGAAA